MRYTGPKNKIARRENTDLSLKTPGTKAHATLLRKLNVFPGQHSVKRRRKTSERGKQLREKQKLRFLFGVTERQLKAYFSKAKSMKGNTGVILSQFLEQRLDNVVYRLGFAPTRASARQLVNHGHVKVNDRVVTIASYRVLPGESISFRKQEKTAKIPYIETSLSNTTLILPSWLERKNTSGVVKLEPSSDDIEKQINMRSVIEFYSR